jgi:hypothetical protein
MEAVPLAIQQEANPHDDSHGDDQPEDGKRTKSHLSSLFRL